MVAGIGALTQLTTLRLGATREAAGAAEGEAWAAALLWAFQVRVALGLLGVFKGLGWGSLGFGVRVSRVKI